MTSILDDLIGACELAIGSLGADTDHAREAKRRIMLAVERAKQGLDKSDKASLVANAANKARVRLGARSGRKGDMTTLARLVNINMEALADIYDEILKG